MEANLQSLGLAQIPVVNPRRHPESDVPFDEQVDAMVGLRKEGHIGHIGLSNVTAEEYAKARTKSDIACVQNAYNIADRSDQEVFDACRADGVAYVPFFPLGSAFHAENPVLGGAGREGDSGEAARHAGPGGVGLAVGAGPDGPADPGDIVARAPRGEPGSRSPAA